MTDLATQIVTALFDQADADGGFNKDKMASTIRTMLADAECLNDPVDV